MARKYRRRRGNILVLIAILGVFFVVASLIAIVATTFFFQHGKTQYKVDALAMTLAPRINDNNRIGRMNQLVARSRELVFVSQQMESRCREEHLEFLLPLCSQLHNDARFGHALVETERRHLAEVITRETQQSVWTYNHHRTSESNFLLSWMKTYEPLVVEAELGYISGVQSSVENPGAIEELLEYDRKMGYLAKGCKLYKPGNARLPSPDGDLDFWISSLPAMVAGTYSPAHPTTVDSFQQLATVFDDDRRVPARLEKQLPSAIRLTSTMDVAVNDDPGKRTSVIMASAAASGGSPEAP